MWEPLKSHPTAAVSPEEEGLRSRLLSTCLAVPSVQGSSSTMGSSSVVVVSFALFAVVAVVLAIPAVHLNDDGKFMYIWSVSLDGLCTQLRSIT